MKNSKKWITLQIDTNKWEEIKKIIKKEEITLSAFVRKCIYEYIEKNKK